MNQELYVNNVNQLYLDIMNEITLAENGRGKTLDEITLNVQDIYKKMQKESGDKFQVVTDIATLSASLFIYNNRSAA